MPRPLLLILFFLSGFTLYSQRYVITGRVTGPSGNPVPDCLIQIGRFSAGSNSNGEYLIQTDLLPDVLTVQHPLYPDKECFIYLPPVGEDTTRLDIQMTTKSTELEEIRITAERTIRVYPKDHVHVIDFDFEGDDMVFICKDKKRYRLRRINSLGDVTGDLPIKDHPWNLFRDCEKRLHLVFHDSVFRIVSSEENLSLTDGQTIHVADQVLAPCVAAAGSKKILRIWGSMGQPPELRIVDTLSHSNKHFYTIENRHYIRIVQEYLYDEAHGGKSYKSDDENQYTYIQERMAAAQEQQAAMDFYMRKSGYAPLFMLRDSLVLFDHLNDTALVYTAEGQVARKYPIIYQYHKKWNDQLILNEEGTRVFACFDYKGMIHLVEVNPDTGQLMKETMLEKHIYPIRIQVKGDFVYYMYHYYIDESINYLYKQKLTQ